MTINVNQYLTREFMINNNIPVRNLPTVNIPYEEKILRIQLLTEELSEFIEAIVNNDINKISDGLADILYVTYGSANTFGIDLQNVFEEVHKSNMTKEYDETKTKKVLKGKDYIPPNIEKVLKEQLEIGSWNQELFNPTSNG